MPRGSPSWVSIFGRFLIDFWCQLRPLEPQESSSRCSESTIYQKIAFRNLYRFFIDFCSSMPPFSFQKSIKNASKLRLGRHQFFNRFLHRLFIDFPSIWEANLGLCWPLRRAQDASKRPPRWLPRRSASHFSILIGFWWILDGFLVDFWWIFNWFWFDFWLIFHRFLVRFLVGVLLVFN